MPLESLHAVMHVKQCFRQERMFMLQIISDEIIPLQHTYFSAFSRAGSRMVKQTGSKVRFLAYQARVQVSNDQ